MNSITVKRLLGYLLKHKITLFVVGICIILSSLTNVAASVFLQILIDNYIVPILGSSNPVFTGMARLILVMACIFIVGIVSGYLYNRLMAVMSQKVLKEIRDEMFEKCKDYLSDTLTQTQMAILCLTILTTPTP